MWGKFMRNCGWICKGPHPGNRQMRAGEQLYCCPYCGVNPANEYCLECAAKMRWQCPRDGNRLVAG